MKNLILFISMIILATACVKAPAGDETKDQKEEAAATDQAKRETYNGFVKENIDNISDDLFLINHQWMLVTGGNESEFNTMTASWGGFGTIWEKPVAFMTIRSTRYTFGFLQKEPVYTISFYDESYKEKMKVLGSKSGRDGNKIKEVGFTPLQMPSGAMAFKEASMIIECRKLLSQPIDPKNMTDKELSKKWYGEEPGGHNLYFGEIIGVWKKAQ